MLKEFTAKLAELKEVAQNSPVIRRKLRGLMNSSSRQYSLDTAMDIVHTVHNCTNQSNTENAVGDATNNVEKSDVADATEDFNGVEDQTRLTKMGTSMTSSISNEIMKSRRQRSKSMTLCGENIDTNACELPEEPSITANVQTQVINEENSSASSDENLSPAKSKIEQS
ncbi:hypothetical protein GQR58_007868 [Nymphon striatum]|nr:hypothetical protein GQR58_007868 [Nymphon striatum]